MKFAILLTFTTTLFIEGVSLGEEKREAKTPRQLVPLTNYWNADSWEEGSSASFWRARSNDPSTKNKNLKSKAKTKSTSEKGFLDRHTEK